MNPKTDIANFTPRLCPTNLPSSSSTSLASWLVAVEEAHKAPPPLLKCFLNCSVKLKINMCAFYRKSFVHYRWLKVKSADWTNSRNRGRNRTVSFLYHVYGALALLCFCFFVFFIATFVFFIWAFLWKKCDFFAVNGKWMAINV